MNRIIKKTIVLSFYFLVLTATQAFAKEITFVEWQSPIPRFVDLNLDVNEVSDIAGDGLFLLMLNEQDIQLWSKGKVRNYSDARMTVAAAVMNAPANIIRKKVLDIQSMPAYMPQISAASIIHQANDQRFMAEWVQTYSLPFLELKAKFVIQHDLEKSGDVSGLLLDGDIDAGAYRWEFIPISENRTLVVHSYWGDQKSAGLAFKIFMAAQPEFELSMGAITPSMILTQLKNEINKTGKDKQVVDNTKLPTEAVIPTVKAGNLSYETIEALSEKGRLVLVGPKIWVQGERDPVPLRFVSAIAVVSEAREALIPFATDYPLMADYLRYYKKLTVEKINDQEWVDAKIKINIGPVFVGVNSKFSTRWNDSKDIQEFKAGEQSDLYPFLGVMEFLPMKEEGMTLMVYTMALDISDDAGWLLRKGKELQEYAMMMSLHQVITLLDKQGELISKGKLSETGK